MKQLVIHVGFHKTGTSFAQSNFRRIASETNFFEDRSIEYLDIAGVDNHISYFKTPNGARRANKRFIDHLSSVIDHTDATTVLTSDEDFLGSCDINLKPAKVYEHAGDAFKLLSSLKSRLTVKVVFSIRPIHSIAESMLLQSVQMGFNAQVIDSLSKVLNNISDIEDYFSVEQFDLPSIIAIADEIFGTDCVFVIPYKSPILATAENLADSEHPLNFLTNRIIDIACQRKFFDSHDSENTIANLSILQHRDWSLNPSLTDLGLRMALATVNHANKDEWLKVRNFLRLNFSSDIESGKRKASIFSPELKKKFEDRFSSGYQSLLDRFSESCPL